MSTLLTSNSNHHLVDGGKYKYKLMGGLTSNVIPARYVTSPITLETLEEFYNADTNVNVFWLEREEVRWI